MAHNCPVCHKQLGWFRPKLVYSFEKNVPCYRFRKMHIACAFCGAELEAKLSRLGWLLVWLSFGIYFGGQLFIVPWLVSNNFDGILTSNVPISINNPTKSRPMPF